ncbi:MAG: DUF4266 domain-containing protein [Polyangiaceae bacterium]
MNRKAARPGESKRRYGKPSRLSACAALLVCSGCATVAPQDRAILADPSMQFDVEAKHDAALRHAIENREGSVGGTGASGGGCGCN